MSEAEPKPLPYEEHVTIHLEPGEALNITVGNGEAVLFLTRGRAPERDTSAEDAPTSPESAAAGNDREVVRDRVNITGRLGGEPNVAPLPKRGLRASFRLGEHLEDGKTVWHEVYATERFARSIAEKQLHRGDEVQVNGERQVDERHQRRRRDGTLEPQVRIYAYGVRLKRRAGQTALPEETEASSRE